MGLAQPKVHYYSLEEYLEIERKADERSEFIDGEIYSIGGDSGKIVVDVSDTDENRAWMRDFKRRWKERLEQLELWLVSYAIDVE